jgi:hypothetical protein
MDSVSRRGDANGDHGNNCDTWGQGGIRTTYASGSTRGACANEVAQTSSQKSKKGLPKQALPEMKPGEAS